MNPIHTDTTTPIRRRRDGSIDYGHYDARARVARSGAFRATCRSVRLLCRNIVASLLGRAARGSASASTATHSTIPPRPQTFRENYAATHRRRELPKAA
ncbi:MAG: hypothetical protein HOK98_07540 [Rhodospirillaceae bacterium]|jgi:hypothetical protein|nr:hypothetical protein [Rhodospirillaceae bacterium]MBT5945153.1 hypothetical protein [Rhodospirillaceae bacterium]MBT6402822.1 hypothetical protein [Rhodospirillaceae bacterium]MBT6536022.1 hypothetical protein [Rhodospirillaceae bacterium]MBT7362174.1 hypothetical protein [Rhodospirillaceae bacterium]